MFHLNNCQAYRQPLDARDQALLGKAETENVARYLATRADYRQTPLHSLTALASALNVGAIFVKDEGQRLGLKSFKALGGAYALACLVIEEASSRLGRNVGFENLSDPDVRAIAATMTFACATDGNHGRSVAQGAQMTGAKSVIFMHQGVSEEREKAIAGFGADVRRVAGSYDDSVREAAQVAGHEGWTVLSDTSWAGYERIPGLVMQGYTELVREALAQSLVPPTHVFIQAGVGGIAAAMAGYLALVFGEKRPKLIVVEPDRAACIHAAAVAGNPVTVAHNEPTVMAMLECYEASPIAWRVLACAADAFMGVGEDDALAVMRQLAFPLGADPVIVAGESGGVGLAGLMLASRSKEMRKSLELDENSRVLVVNTEGATDPALYEHLVGKSAQHILEPGAMRNDVN